MSYQLTGDEFSELYLNRSAAMQTQPQRAGSLVEQAGLFTMSMQSDFLPMGSVNVVSGTFMQNVTVKEVAAHSHVGLHFQLTGNGGGHFSGLEKPTRMQAGRHNLFYHSNPSGDLLFSAQQSYQYLVILLQPEWLRSKLELYAPLHEPLLTQLHRQQSCTAQPVNGIITTPMQEAITALTRETVKGPLRSLYLEAKVLELLTLQLDQLSQTPPESAFSPRDIDALQEAKAFLTTHFQEPGNLRDIALRFGLNEFKLKKGFKELFHTTVWDYVVDRRLHHARLLLLERTHTVSEATMAVGYESVSHFVSVFKRKFGVSPGKLH
ncbi:AraC family transcriptional regulator [Nibrella saemangeumensis]|uniref:AraC family transcriptional regulator n=1 Tax=Nibrella saemangeumensis TaxID=1084526 RepID=A0ABP8NQ63_9BACT